MRMRALVSLMLMLFACRDNGGDNRVPSTALAKHDTAPPNERFPVSKLSCADGADRTIGSGRRLELIVFASPMDCVLKRDHLVRVHEALVNSVRPPAALIVSSVPVDERAAAERLFSPILGLPLCWDQHERLKTSLNIMVGPATMLIRDGRIVWRADGAELVSSDMLRAAIEREKPFPNDSV